MAEEIILKAIDWAFKAFLFVSFFWILIAGFRNEVVIFYNKFDFWRAVLTPVIGGLLAYFVDLKINGGYASYSTEWLMTWVVMPLMGLILVIMLLDSLIVCIKHNRSWPIGLMVFFYRTLYLFGALLMALKALDGGEKQSFTEKMARLGVAVAILYGAYRLVNGEKVYRNKGWEWS